MKRLLLLFLLVPALAFGQTMPERVLKVAADLSYVREKTNHNDAPEIDRMLAYVGIPKGNPWCLAFGVWCYHVATMPGPNPLPKIARVSLFWSITQENELRFKTFTAEDVAWGVEKAQPADVACFSHNKTVKNKNWDGHAALVVKQLSKNTIQTIEGNTSSGETGSQREGNGVFYRVRQAGIKALYLEGFVRPIKG